MHQGKEGHGATGSKMVRHHYIMLGVNLTLSLIIMYLAMFVMIWSLGDFFNNLNMFYMALVMWAPMSAVMLLTMKNMYPRKQLNLALHAGFAIILVLSFYGVREQLAVGDRQFLRSMIPHHSGAILMCEEARLADPEIKTLCDQIVRSQIEEIEQMKALLARD